MSIKHPVAYDIDGTPRPVLVFEHMPHVDTYTHVAHGKPDHDGWPTEYWIQRSGRKFRLIENGWSDDDHESLHDGMYDAIKEATRRFRA